MIHTEIHNRIAGDCVKMIVKEPLLSGGEFTDVMVILESVIMGVILAGIKITGDELALELLMEHVRERLAQARLTMVEPAGEA